MSTDDIRGYDVETLSEVPKTVICPLCTFFIKNAVQTNRGERACKDCFVTASKELPKGICPIDGGKDTITFKDKYTDKQVLGLPVFCQSKKNGCGWNGLLKVLEEHVEQCQFKAAHVAEKDVNELVACPWKCGVAVGLDANGNHVTDCIIASSTSHCVFKPFGCDFHDNEPIRNHMNSNAMEHATLITTEIIKRNLSLKQAEKKVLEQQQQIDNLNQKLVAETKKNVNLKYKLNETIEECVVTIKQNEQKRMCAEKRTQSKIEALEIRGQELDEIKKTLKGLDMNSGDVKARKQQLQPQQQSQKMSEDTKKVVEECNKNVKLCETTCHSIRASVDELDLKQQLLENTCYGGRFLWKISNLDNRIVQARDGLVTALHSAPYFTKKFGYKFCTRLYLNGDGEGKRTHVSLFFVMMRSEYDELLDWPFEQRVSFKLINTTKESLSVSESFTPDRSSASFRRPVRDMNVGAGCPKFVLQKDLNNFIVDNSIYIETTVEKL